MKTPPPHPTARPSARHKRLKVPATGTVALSVDITTQLVDAVCHSEAFRGLAPQHVMAMLRVMTPRWVRPEEVVIRAGDAGDTMLIVGSGRYDVRLEREGGLQTTVATIGPGEAVGEMAFLDPAPRSATLVALTEGWVLELPRTRLSNVRSRAPHIFVDLVTGIRTRVSHCLREVDERIAGLMRFVGEAGDTPPAPVWEGRLAEAPGVPLEVDLRTYARFATFADADLQALTAIAPARRWSDGDDLCIEASSGGCCYVLLSGEVEVLKACEGELRSLAVLGAGEVVGQLALIEAVPRTATVRARGDVVALRMERAGFKQLLGQCNPLAMTFHLQTTVAGIRQLRAANKKLRELDHDVAVIRELREEAARQGRQLPTRETAGSRRRAEAWAEERRHAHDDALRKEKSLGLRQAMDYVRGVLAESGVSEAALRRIGTCR